MDNLTKQIYAQILESLSLNEAKRSDISMAHQKVADYHDDQAAHVRLIGSKSSEKDEASYLKKLAALHQKAATSNRIAAKQQNKENINNAIQHSEDAMRGDAESHLGKPGMKRYLDVGHPAVDAVRKIHGLDSLNFK